MPVLKNARHERFAQLIVSGLPASQAHVQAGFVGSAAAHEANASRLIRHDKVAARIVELQTPALELAQATAEWIVARAVEVVERSLEHSPVYVGQGKNRRVLEGVFEYDARGVVGALALLAKRHPEFRDAPAIDQSQHLHLPPGTTLDDVRALVQQLRALPDG